MAQRGKGHRRLGAWRSVACFVAALVVIPSVAAGQEAGSTAEGEQDEESKALDSTATQWSFQFAWQNMTYHADTLDDGTVRKAGADDYVQLRIVAPVALKSLTILPRLTIRHYEVPQFDSTGAQTGSASGLGNTELFAKLADLGVAVLHCRLGEPNLGLGQVEPPPSFSAAGAGSSKAGPGSLPDQLALELR